MHRYEVRNIDDAYYLQVIAKRLAEQMGFSEKNQTEIAISVSELTTNIVKYSKHGEILFNTNDGNYLEIMARDEGPGIKNVEMAFKDHYSDTRCLLDDNFRNHKGRGTGLPAVKRLMDECWVESTGSKGTVIIARKKLST